MCLKWWDTAQRSQWLFTLAIKRSCFLPVISVDTVWLSVWCSFRFLVCCSWIGFHNHCVDREQKNRHWYIWKCHSYLNVSLSLLSFHFGCHLRLKDGRGNDLPNESVSLTICKLHAPQPHWGTKILMYSMSSVFHLPATTSLLFHSCSLDSYLGISVLCYLLAQKL